MRTHVMYGENVRMIQRACSTGFLLKSVKSFLVVRKRRPQDLHCNIATQACVTRAIHLAHSTRTKWCDDFVAAEPGPGSNSHKNRKRETVCRFCREMRWPGRSPSLTFTDASYGRKVLLVTYRA